jgi:hypothetical protein
MRLTCPGQSLAGRLSELVYAWLKTQELIDEESAKPLQRSTRYFGTDYFGIKNEQFRRQQISDWEVGVFGVSKW